MSKLIYICGRAGESLRLEEGDLARVLERLRPDHLRPRPARIIAGEGRLIGIFNPTETLPVQGYSVCLGRLFERRPDWWKPGAEAPDGSYALFRGEGETLELMSDAVGSRTIWYAQTDELFVAATSQRAIVCLLRSYEPNEAVYPWMLSSGTLGPGLSWDRRIRCLGPDSRLRLDRRRWEVRVEQRPVEFVPEALPRAEHERRLREALEETFAGLDLEPGRWVLPLSGGYDSRAILLFLKERSGLRTVTWGLKAALEDTGSDAWVARKLARHFGLVHEYYETDLSEEPVERIFERYLVAGEGRVDHISGYMDGFALWKRLFETGCQGILRGDQAFGCRAVRNDRQVLLNMGLTVLADFGNLPQALAADWAAGQQRPRSLTRGPGEGRDAWRDRLSAAFEIPVIFAALSDLKLPYVEVVQPLLSRRIIAAARALPDGMRTDKRLLKAIVNHGSSGIGYAKTAAIGRRADVLRQPAVERMIINALQGFYRRDGAIGRIAQPVITWMEEAGAGGRRMPAGAFQRRLRLWAGRLAGLHACVPWMIDPNRAGLRLCIIGRMDEMLRADALSLPDGDGIRQQ